MNSTAMVGIVIVVAVVQQGKLKIVTGIVAQIIGLGMDIAMTELTNGTVFQFILIVMNLIVTLVTAIAAIRLVLVAMPTAHVLY